jgi:Domain of unknown function (DUF5060)
LIRYCHNIISAPATETLIKTTQTTYDCIRRSSLDFFPSISLLLLERNEQATQLERTTRMNFLASTSSMIALQLLLVLFVVTTTLLVDEATSQEVEQVGVITGFRLINTETEAEIGQLANNQVLVLDALPPEWTIVATTSSEEGDGPAGSVAFNLDGDSEYRTENVEPWTMTGDEDGDYYAWSPVPLGKHTLIATPYENTNRRGVEGTLMQVAFTVEATSSTSPSPSPPPLPTSDVPPYNYSATGALSGELRKWHKITLGFVGPFASETDVSNNPFTSYLLNVAFTHFASGKTYLVPGYFAADGNAANTGASAGNVWLCHFAPDTVGKWTWVVQFYYGINASWFCPCCCLFVVVKKNGIEPFVTAHFSF